MLKGIDDPITSVDPLKTAASGAIVAPGVALSAQTFVPEVPG